MSDAVSLVVFIESSPEARPQVVELITRLAPAVHAEPGCERYAVHTSGKGQVTLLEKWTDRDALQAHGEGPVMAELLAGLRDLGASAPIIHMLRPVPAGDPLKGTV